MKKYAPVITNVLLTVFGVMMLCFGCGYYLAGFGSGYSGYKYLDLLQTSLKGAKHAKAEVYLYIAGMIMAIIFVSLLIALALLSLLCNFKVIKNEKVGKIVDFAKLVLAVLACIAFILVLISIVSMIKNVKFTVGYGLIVNVVLSVLSVVAVLLTMFLTRKKKA